MLMQDWAVISTHLVSNTKQTNKFRGPSPRGNYTDQAAATCRRR
jgi:hypothetical protein